MIKKQRLKKYSKLKVFQKSHKEKCYNQALDIDSPKCGESAPRSPLATLGENQAVKIVAPAGPRLTGPLVLRNQK